MASERNETGSGEEHVKGRSLGVLKAFYASRNPARLRDAVSDMRAFVSFCGVKSEDDVERLLFGPDGTDERAQALVTRYRDHLVSSGLAYGTINRKLALVRTLSKFACTLGVVRWRINVSAKGRKSLRDTRGVSKPALRQAARMNGTSRQARRDRAIVLVAAALRVKRGELVALDLEHYIPDPDGPGVMVGGTLTPLNAETKIALDAWVEVRGFASGALFTTLDGARSRLAAEDLIPLMRPGALGD